jgi:hypothetical protein
MCYDDRYLKTRLVTAMARQLGVFPHAARYVRLVLENPFLAGDDRFENVGLYLLMDDPTSALKNAFLRLRTVVRRRNDAFRSTAPLKGTPEVKFTRDESESSDDELSEVQGLSSKEIETRDRYDEIAVTASTCLVGSGSTPAAGCYESLDEKLDLEQYFRWTALMTFIKSGDHVDESWFYASRELNDGGFKNDERFQMHAWDPDDAFESCHHDGRNALYDPYGLLVCTEGDLDIVFTRDPRVYEAFVDALEWTLRDAFTDARMTEIKRDLVNELERVLIDDKTASGLEELVAVNQAAVTKEGALTDIKGSLEFYHWLLKDRRREVLRKIARYRRIEGTHNPVATAARAALDRGRKRSPFAESVGTKRVTFAKRNQVANASRGLRFEARLEEHRYDAAPGTGFQELVVSEVRFTNDDDSGTDPGSSHSLSLRDGPTVTIPTRKKVFYENAAYEAPPWEMRVECTTGPENTNDSGLERNVAARVLGGNGTDATADATADAFNSNTSFCVLPDSVILDARAETVLERFDAVLYAAFGDGAVSFRFARFSKDCSPARDGTPCERRREAIAVPPGATFATAAAVSVSVRHRDWLPFPDGISAERFS